jgi:hypothetical protein
VEPLAAELVDQVRSMVATNQARFGYLLEPQHSAALWAWARCEAKVQLLEEYLLDEGGMLDDDGEVRAATDLLERVERRALKLRERLGLDPRSEAELRRARAGATLAGFDIDAALTAGRRVIDARSDAAGITAAEGEADRVE